MSLRFLLAMLLYPVAWAVPAGIGTTAIMSVPPLAADAARLLPYIGAESFVIGAAIAWHLAPLLLSRRACPLAARFEPQAHAATPWRRL
ncbi:hypothetical protein [Enterovirga aerilata]|uniref:Uncharacterized protein n=1 Tax=Enterovirga aerilata TaxID=2730920 RepID=A0A849IGU9_9HYPH|nr:hypothetical protein [Enterovirga sp. DB1703]NNM73143.1 hypothetical protein [Enterovirga sp. DB1703]